MVKGGLILIIALVFAIATANWIVLHQLKENNLAQTNIVDMISSQEEMGGLIKTLLTNEDVKPETIIYKFQDEKAELETTKNEILNVMDNDIISFFITDLQSNTGIHKAINELFENQKKLEQYFLKATELYKKKYVLRVDNNTIVSEQEQILQDIKKLLADNKQIGFFIENIVENSLSKQIEQVYLIIVILLIVTIIAILFLGYKIYTQVGFSVDEIEERVSQGLSKIQSLNEEIEATQREVILTMGSIAEKHNKETSNHLKRVSQYCYLLAKYYGLSEHECHLIQLASPMHDIGKLAIPDNILHKKSPLNEAERRVMMQHTVYGYKMLKHSKRELLRSAATIAYEHHEKWDGTGYPLGLKGEEIHIFGRITAIADVFDALSSQRSYKSRWSNDEILKYMRTQSGKHFDPALIEIFFEHIDEFIAIQEALQDQEEVPTAA